MLTYPQPIMGQWSTLPNDYPVLDSNNAIAADVVWLWMPDRFPKDNFEVAPNLFGGATLDSGGMTVPSSGGGASWDRPTTAIDALLATQEITFIWHGNVNAYDEWACFFSINGSDMALQRVSSGTQARFISNPCDSGYLQVTSVKQQYALSWDGSRARYYRDGDSYDSKGLSEGFAIDGSGPLVICNGSIDGGNTIRSEDVSLALLANRTLSSSEIAAVWSDPYQLVVNA